MYAASAAFIAAVSGGSYARLLRLEQLDPADLHVVADVTPLMMAGSIDGRAKEDGRRSLSMTIANDNGAVTPQQITDPYWVNNPLRVSYGVAYQDGTSEFVPLGTFLVNRAWSRSDETHDVLDVDAVDFWKKAQYTKLLSNASYAAGSTLLAAIVDLCTRMGIGAAQRNIDPAAGATTFHGGNAGDLNIARGTPIADCLAMLAEDFGYLFYFDVLGVFVARPKPTVGSLASVFTMNELDPLVLDVEGGIEDSLDIVNHVGVSSTDASIQPVYQEAKDTNTNSPTYVGGSFGDRYLDQPLDWVQNATQATAAAKSILARRIGDSRKADYFHAPRPELDVDDVGSLTSSSLGFANKQYAIDSFSIPLAAGDVRQRTSLVEVRSLP